MSNDIKSEWSSNREMIAEFWDDVLRKCKESKKESITRYQDAQLEHQQRLKDLKNTNLPFELSTYKHEILQLKQNSYERLIEIKTTVQDAISELQASARQTSEIVRFQKTEAHQTFSDFRNTSYFAPSVLTSSIPTSQTFTEKWKTIASKRYYIIHIILERLSTICPIFCST